MGTRPHTSSAERAFAIPILMLVLLVVSALAACSGTPRLAAEDRRGDVEYLARRANEYHACVEVNSKVGGMPDYEKSLQDPWIQSVISGFSTPVAESFAQHQ